MKRFGLILCTALIAALVCWCLILNNRPASSSVKETPSQAERDAFANAESHASTAAREGEPRHAASTASPDATDAIRADTSAETAALEAARADAILARTPKGIWAKRAPAIDDYLASIPAEHAPALATFRTQFPDLDPTDVKDFNQAYLHEFTRHGDTLDENTAKLFNAWLEPMLGMQKAAVAARAQLVGVALRDSEPLDLEGNSREFVLAGFDDAAPRYYHTINAAAAESTGANLVLFNPNYDERIASSADGTGLYINVNDAGLIYEHPEFQLPDNGGSRIVYKDSGSTNDSHATHVAGTIACWGYNANLMGMAPRAWLRSFDGFDFNRGVTSHGMMWPGQTHSTTNPRTGEPEMKSVVSSASLITGAGGKYTSESRSTDYSLNSYPYLTYFFGAGNDGSGFATVASDQTSTKNGVTIGAVKDTTRDDDGAYVSGGSIEGFSSRGPTYDGRIKPDLTANGTGLTSPWTATTTATKSGTSMATPNASGSAALLIDYITRKLPGHYFRSSTIKALLVNTATDRGNAGPDYIYGYGIVNVKAACDIVKRYAEDATTRVVLEDTLSSGQTWTQTYTYDGSGPIRLTLAWLDPAGTGLPYNTTDRTPRLVNDLNVRLIGPGGSTTYEPFVMPFTTGNGTYSAYDSNLCSAVAVTGNNFTDNLEQILVATPPAGTYTLQVTHSGALKDDADQLFSLAVTGLSGATSIAPSVSSISPNVAPHVGPLPNNFMVSIDGSGFMLGSDVFLRRAASNGTTDEAKGYGIIPVANRIIARFDLATLTPGYWDVVVRTPDGTEAILPDGFLIPEPAPRTILYANNFESGATDLTLGTGWSVADPNKGSVSGPADAQQGTKALVTYAGQNYAGNLYSNASTPLFSTIGYVDLKVEFQRWLGVGAGDTAIIRHRYGSTSSYFTSDLASHTNLMDTGWSTQSYSLSQYAADKSAVNIEFRITTDSANHSFGWNIDDLKVTGVSTTAPVTYPPAFTSTAVTTATQGQPYSHNITTSDADTAGTSLILAASDLPTGLTFTPDSSGGATLSGTPSGHGVFSIRISVTDGSYTTYQNFSLAISPSGGNSAPVITTTSLPNAFQGEAYSTNIAATDNDGHSLSFSLTSPLPAWLSFTDNGNGTATLSGTPIIGALTSYPIDVSVSDGFVITTKSLTLVVEPRADISFSTATASVNEAAGTVSLTVNRTVNSAGPITLSYSCANGSAGAADYTAVTDTLIWNDGDQSPRTIIIPILQDSASELSETFTVTLSSLTGIADLGTSVTTVTILDDDPAFVTVDVTDNNCGEASSNDGIFTLTRTGSISSSQAINYSISGTATNGTDYTQLNGTINFSANSSTANVIINPIQDSDYEGDESVILTLESGAGYNLGNPHFAEITLTDNDKPAVSITAAANTVGEDAGTTTLIFNRSGINTLGPLTVNFALSGTTTSGSDYQALATNVVIPQSQSEATFTVTILNDTTIETDETLIATISSNSAYNIAAPPDNETTITIRDDDDFSSWIAQQSGVGGLSAATDDPDADGFDNLLEYALGTLPGNAASVPVMTTSLTSSFKFTFTPARIYGLSYFIESSSNLTNWAETEVTSLLTTGQPYEHTDPAPVADKRFLRLKVTEP